MRYLLLLLSCLVLGCQAAPPPTIVQLSHEALEPATWAVTARPAEVQPFMGGASWVRVIFLTSPAIEREGRYRNWQPPRSIVFDPTVSRIVLDKDLDVYRLQCKDPKQKLTSEIAAVTWSRATPFTTVLEPQPRSEM